MDNTNKPKRAKDSVGIYKTTFKSGKLAGKIGFRGTVTPEVYNELVGKLTPGCSFMMVENEYKTEDKHPDYRLFIVEPRPENTGF